MKCLDIVERFLLQRSLKEWEKKWWRLEKKMYAWKAQPFTPNPALIWLNDRHLLPSLIYRQFNFRFKNKEFVDNQIGSFAQSFPPEFLPLFYDALSKYPTLGTKNWLKLSKLRQQYIQVAYQANELRGSLELYQLPHSRMQQFLSNYPANFYPERDPWSYHDYVKHGQDLQVKIAAWQQQQDLDQDTPIVSSLGGLRARL